MGVMKRLALANVQEQVPERYAKLIKGAKARARADRLRAKKRKDTR